MTAIPGMRDLAHRLLTYEAVVDETPEPVGSAAIRVYEKMRQSLCALAGVAGFQSLAFRALTQAKSEAPSLWPVQIAADGSLRGLGEYEPQIDMDKDLADKTFTDKDVSDKVDPDLEPVILRTGLAHVIGVVDVVSGADSHTILVPYGNLSIRGGRPGVPAP